MAKRVTPGEKIWNPVEAQLAHAVLSPESATSVSEQAPPAPSTPRVVSLEAHRGAVADKPKEEPKNQEDEVEALTREKRYLLTESEEETLERLVKDMGKKLKTSLTLSHVVRATLSLLLHSQDEIIKQSEKMGRLKRPPNHDRAALSVFEHNVARVLDRAIRGSRVIE